MYIFQLLLAALIGTIVQAQQLPDCPELDVADDISLPEGIEIPDGFEITCEIVSQYLVYLDDNGGEDNAPLSGDRWFKELATAHPNGLVGLEIEQADKAKANEESSYDTRLSATFLSKEVILPTVVVVILLVSTWAFLTRCG